MTNPVRKYSKRETTKQTNKEHFAHVSIDFFLKTFNATKGELKTIAALTG